MNAQHVAPGILYLPRFVDDPDAVIAAVCEQVIFAQRVRILYGRHVATPRMEAWHGPTPYRFGGSELPAAPMPRVLQSLALRAEQAIDGARFDSCLVNLYRDGRDSVAWHSDDEPEMGDPIIASISLGATRPFLLQRKTGMTTRLRVVLEHGSMLVMLRGVQTEWVHCLPKVRGLHDRRVNLTLRDCRKRASHAL